MCTLFVKKHEFSTLFTTPSSRELHPPHYQPPLPAPSGGPRPFVFVLTRAALCRRAPSRRIRGPAETHALGSLHSRRRLGLSPLEVPPPANLRCELRRASLVSKGAPPQPCDRTHTHATLRMQRSATDCAAHAAPFIPHPAPALPHKLHTPHSAPGCVAHTQWVPARCTGGARRYRGRTARVFFAATARAAFLLGDRLPTHSLTTAHGPPLSIYSTG